jgi:hypothetical protein
MTSSQTLPATTPAAYDDGWNDIDANDRVIQGELIKCVDGQWSSKDGTPVPKRLLALATITMLQLWKNKIPVQTIVKRPGQPWPNVDELNAEIPQEDWELGLDGNLRPPWQRQFAIYLLDPDTAANYTFANGTAGASIAVSNLKDAIKWQRALRGDNVLPLVELSNKPMKTKFGSKLRPHFQIVEWRNLDAGFSVHPHQPQVPAPAEVVDDGRPWDDDVNNLPFDN